jgi:hypothetical protein
MHTPLIAGRTFTEGDNTADRSVLIVDQALASKAFPFESAVGKRILFRARAVEAQWGEIVGVVAHQRYVSLATPGREQIYVTDGYIDHVAANWWALRTARDPNRFTGSVREQIRKLAPRLLVIEPHSMDELVTHAKSNTLFSLVLISVFAIVATLLAAVGLYSILSTLVRQRTAEIGVRMAVGAAPPQVLWLVVGYGLRLSTTGVLIGLFAAFALTRVMTSMLIGVKATDPITFAIISILFIFIAVSASWVPARRAAKLDPMIALREE